MEEELRLTVVNENLDTHSSVQVGYKKYAGKGRGIASSKLPAVEKEIFTKW